MADKQHNNSPKENQMKKIKKHKQNALFWGHFGSNRKKNEAFAETRHSLLRC